MRLRELKEKDADGMLEWMNDPEIMKNFRFSSKGRDKEQVLHFIRTATTQIVDGQSMHFAVVDDNDEYLGTISLKEVDLVAKNAEYAISLRKRAQGKGIGTEATQKLLKLAFEEFDLERVYLNVLSENRRAMALYEKCGFVYEGEFRKHLFLAEEYKSLKWYSMLKEDYSKMLEGK